MNNNKKSKVLINHFKPIVNQQMPENTKEMQPKCKTCLKFAIQLLVNRILQLINRHMQFIIQELFTTAKNAKDLAQCCAFRDGSRT